jgi:virginiamycin B lyase
VGLTVSGEIVWFAEIGSGKIGRCSTSGEVTEYPHWDNRAKPHAIVADPVGGFWFTA